MSICAARGNLSIAESILTTLDRFPRRTCGAPRNDSAGDYCRRGAHPARFYKKKKKKIYFIFFCSSLEKIINKKVIKITILIPINK